MPGSGPRYHLTTHACRHCGHRILENSDSPRGKLRLFLCSGCGAQGNGSAESLCCCGLVNKGTGQSLNLRCTVNTHKTPQMPFDIVVQLVRPSTAPAAVGQQWALTGLAYEARQLSRRAKAAGARGRP